MDERVKGEVSEHRQRILARECFLVEQIIEQTPQLFDDGSPRVIDVGCGSYNLMYRAGKRLAGLKAGSIGIDMDRAALSVNPDVGCCVCGSCYSLPFPSESADIILCRWVFEHLEYPERALKEFSRVLRKGGVVYIKTPNLLNYGMMISWATPVGFHNAYLSKLFSKENTRTFYRANTTKKLTALAAQTGFVIRNLESHSGSFLYYGFNKELFLLMRRLSRIMSKVTTSMQQTLMCVLQKA